MSKEMNAQNSTVGDIQRRVDAIDVVFNHFEAASQAELTPMYDAYVAEVKGLKKAAKKSDSQFADLLDTRENYVADWQTEHKQLTEPTLRKAADASYQQTMAHYDKVSNRASSMHTAYNTYITDLNQIDEFLKSNLSKESIARISHVINKARTDGDSLKASAREYQISLNQAQGSLPPTYR